VTRYMLKKCFEACTTGLFVAASVIANVPIVQAAEIFTVEDPTGTPLNVRGVRGKVICTLSNGEILEKIPKDGAFAHFGPEWTTIRTKSGCLGRVWAEYLRSNY